jgi:hypothetical protein
MRTSIEVSFAAGALAFALGVGGCAAETNDGAAEGEGALAGQALSLKTSGDGFVATDKPALSAAEGTLTCGDRFEVDGNVRVTCTRGKEVLDVIVHTAEKKALLAYRPEGRFKDKRTFFDCTTSGNAGTLPAKFACSAVEAHNPGSSVSPFASTVEGITVANAHQVGNVENLYRGMEPRKEGDFTNLLGAGVGAVLAFKNQTSSGADVAAELDQFVAGGIARASAKQIPFQWNDLNGFTEPCEQVIEGLKFLKKNLDDGKKTYFHCTVGEDRTGFLAGMHRLLNEKNSDPKAIFHQEMCENGFGTGNPLKPAFVAGAVDRELGALYRKMTYLVSQGAITYDNLDAGVCATDPETANDYEAKAVAKADLHCGTSTRFVP